MQNDPAIFWEAVLSNEKKFSESIAGNAEQIIGILLLQLLEDEAAHTGLTFDDETAILPWDQYNSETTLALRYHRAGHFDLYFQYYDNDAEDNLETAYQLSEEEVNNLPAGLTWLLKETIAKSKPQRIDPKTLSS